MSHVLTFVSEDAHEVNFQCANCGKPIGFVKPVDGEPNPTQNPDGSWSPPENPEPWMGPCNV